MTSNTNNYITKSQKLQLIDSLRSVPSDLALVPVTGKAPKRSGWSDEPPLTHDSIISEINAGKATGYGLRLGPVSGGVISVDVDGIGCHSEYEKIFGCLPNSDPTTVKITSGKPGRQAEFYRIPEIYWSEIKTKSFKSGVIGSDGKEENLEIHWQGKQQVLPPSKHPETKQYNFLPGCSFSDVEIAIAPIELIEKILKDDQPLLVNSNIMPAVTDAISLSKIICKGSRDILNGSHEGSRNNDGAKLARDLIGTEARAKVLGIELSDTADQLFFDYCSRCTPPLSKRESNSIWKSALKDNPTASMSDDYILNCANAGKYKDELAVKRENKVNIPVNIPAGNVVAINDHVEKKIVNLDNLHQEIDELINNDELTTSKQKLALAKLRKKHGISENELKEIFNARKKELDSIDCNKDDFDTYFDSTQKHLSGIKHFLPGKLINISTICTNLGLTPEAGIMMLYSAVCSLLHPDTELEVFKETMFVVNPTIYCAIIGESGIKKSPLQRILIVNPLRELDKIEQARYEQKKLEYDSIQDEKQKAEMGEPVKRTLFIGGGTSEGIRELCKVNKGRGILRLNDELSSLFDSQGKYSNGKGDDQQQILSAYDGYLPTVARVGQKGYVAGTADRVNLPIIGAIQPTVLKKIFVKRDVDDPAGEFARFMLCQQPCKPAHIGDATQIEIDLNDYLAGFLKQVDSIGLAKFYLASGARKLFEKFYDRCEDKKVSDLAEAIKHQYQKLPGKVAKIALIIHIVTAIENILTAIESGKSCQEIPEIPSEISEITMKAAMSWGNYQSAQVISFYNQLDSQSINPLLRKILEIIENLGDKGASAADIRSKIAELKKAPKEHTIDLMQTLVKFGYCHQEKVNGTNRLFRIKDSQLSCD